jgi:hypothetical protein
MIPTILSAIALTLASTLAQAQSTPPAPAPADGIGEFTTRATKYATLRGDLERGLPVLTGTEEPAHVRTVEVALAQRLRDARPNARQGDLFTPQATAAFRTILRQMDGSTWKMIMDANPGPFVNRVNDAYPKSKPLSTMPPDLLARLPRLPEGLQYRFVGADLILHDTRSNLIVDRIPEAIPMSGPPRRR